jgi:hypothetical protein
LTIESALAAITSERTGCLLRISVPTAMLQSAVATLLLYGRLRIVIVNLETMHFPSLQSIPGSLMRKDNANIGKSDVVKQTHINEVTTK